MHAKWHTPQAPEKLANRPRRKVGVGVLCGLNPHLAMGVMASCLFVLLCTGCISTGETIRVKGVVVDTAGNTLPHAVVTATGAKRGGTLYGSGDRTQAQDESREAEVQLKGDGRFTATSRWAGRLTLSVDGYKIRRVDDLGTEFLVPSRSFYQSQDQVRLEVVKDE